MNGLQSKFTKKYIYYVGAYEGCSCAFASDPIQDLQEDIYDLYDDNDASRLHNSIESVTSLLDLIETLTKSDNLEFYCCWEEVWNEPVESYEEIDIRDVELGFNYFGLEEKRFINFPAQYQ